jgi:NitT/TauT family transport system permease protein
VAVAAFCVVLWGATQAILMPSTVTWPDLQLLLEGAGATFLRVNTALLIAGATSIPSDLREVSSLLHFTQWQRWTKLILPGIFPYLITGMVTARGGAWNASVFAEYSQIPGGTLQTIGLGAQIDQATATGRFPVLLLATILISLIVVTINRLVWRRLYHLAETRYKLEG